MEYILCNYIHALHSECNDGTKMRDDGTAVMVTVTGTCMVTVRLQLLFAVAVALAVALVVTAVKVTHSDCMFMLPNDS